jgi:hypothetical protein
VVQVLAGEERLLWELTWVVWVPIYLERFH